MAFDDSSSMPPSDAIFSSQEAISHAIPSSPPSLPSRSNKPKRPPTVTPRRFNRFFNPSSSRQRDSSPSISARALKSLTAGSVNSRRPSSQSGALEFEDFPDPRPSKRRKHINWEQDVPVDYDSDALLRSSPAPSSPCPTPLARHKLQDYRDSIRRQATPYIRARQPKVVVDHRYNAADFCSQPEDTHAYATSSTPALPFCVASCNTNSLIALGDEEGHIRIVETAKEGKPDFNTSLLSFKPHNNAIMGVTFSSDDRWLATSSGDQTVKIIDMYKQKTAFVLANHISSVKQAVFQPGDDNVLATCSRDGAVTLWDLRCGGRNPVVSVASLGDIDEHARHAAKTNCIPDAHRPDLAQTRNLAPPPPVTSISFLSASRSNLILTSSDASARLRLWDIRARHTTNTARLHPIPLATTTAPPSHEYTITQSAYGPSIVSQSRPKGISSISLNTDSTRIYALCKDNTIYAYSTNHLILGQAPELQSDSKKPRSQHKEQDGMGPLYGLRHSALSTRSFYVRSAIRPGTSEHDELLAVGSSSASPVLFPTDERHYTSHQQQEYTSASADMLPIYTTGTALIRGHEAEVTGVTWTQSGELVSVGDDYKARVWREDRVKARELRQKGEGEGQRWGCGWADVGDAEWDEEDG